MATAEELSIQTLKNALGQKAPYCAGAMVIPAEEFTLFYGKDDTIGYV